MKSHAKRWIAAAVLTVAAGTVITVGCTRHQDVQPVVQNQPPAVSQTSPAAATSPATPAPLADALPYAAGTQLSARDRLASGAAKSGFGGGAGLPRLRDKTEAGEMYNRMDAESYSRIDDNPFKTVAEARLSTFSLDVDTASYSIMRRYLESGQLPPADAVRVEEMVNYFPYSYPQPKGDAPFSVSTEVTTAPWEPSHKLVRIGLKGREFEADKRPPCNLVFLIDTSGSMMAPNRLPLLKRGLSDLVRRLGENDTVTIVTYAGNAGLALACTPGTDREKILAVLESLEAGGSTNGGAGIERAYAEAQAHFVKNGVNRVMLCTDGDFNVGVTSPGELTRLIEDKAKSKVYLSVLGFGYGNNKDSTLEELSKRGNGNYAYIDTMAEARKVLVEQAAGTLVTIAKDVKVQVEFNPAEVAGYRLVGYEHRLLQDRDFNDDTKDAGEIGAGHTVTALYEIVPAGTTVPEGGSVDPLKYQRSEPRAAAHPGELLTVKLRYKAPDADAVQGTSKLIEVPVKVESVPFGLASADTRFATGVAEFGMVLRKSKWVGRGDLKQVESIVQGTLERRTDMYSTELAELVARARRVGTTVGTQGDGEPVPARRGSRRAVPFEGR